MTKKKFRVLISVSDKTGLIEFVNQLNKNFSLEIVSTGGTAKHLINAGFKVKTAEQITKFPEILDGRVKTLHPKIHGGLLADKRNSKHLKELKKYNIKTFDIVVVNLYPFEKTIKRKDITLNEAIEQIDIGGVALLRAAAKNFQSVIAICNPNDYLRAIKILKEKHKLSFYNRKKLAQKIFKLTSRYDKIIKRYLSL